MTITPLHSWIAQNIGSSGLDFSPAALAMYQLNQLESTIRYAVEKSPFYRDQIGRQFKQLHSLEELPKLPFTKPDDLRENPTRFVCLPQDDISRIITLPTSGTSGPSKRVFFSNSDQELTVDFFHRGMSTLAREGDRVLVLLPGPRPGSVGNLLGVALKRLGCVPFEYGLVDDEQKILDLIRNEWINVLVGVPIQLMRLAKVDCLKKNLGKGKIRTILTSTDNLPTSIRYCLQNQWGCEVFDHYGMTETGLGGGVECDVHDGFHMRAADLYYEVIHPTSGQVLPIGEAGEIVFSTLTRNAMPLIRYRTGDIGRILPGVCNCGSFIQRIGDLTHRVGCLIRLSEGEIKLGELDEVMFALPGLLDYQVNVDRMDHPSWMKIFVKMIKEWNEIDWLTIKKAAMQLPSLASAVQNRNLTITYLPLESQPVERTGYLAKRSIRVSD